MVGTAGVVGLEVDCACVGAEEEEEEEAEELTGALLLGALLLALGVAVAEFKGTVLELVLSEEA